MAKYNIIQTDNPIEYKDQIQTFWKEEFKNTPIERFDWLNKGNPAGKTTWFIALQENTNKIIGTVSLVKKSIFLSSTKYFGSIMGDLVVDKKHRVFGPTMKLLKEAVKWCEDNNLSFIYTIPNIDSLKLVQRAGFKDFVELITYVKVLDVAPYLDKFLPRVPYIYKLVMVKTLNNLLRLFLGEIVVISKGFDESTIIDHNFDALAESIKHSNQLVGNHSSNYLKWRYQQNPLYDFKILSYKKGHNIVGYLIYIIDNRKMEIFDLISSHPDHTNKLIKKIVMIARREKCCSMYFTIPQNSHLYAKLKSFGFLDTKTRMQLYWRSFKGISLDKWNFFQGDRNI